MSETNSAATSSTVFADPGGIRGAVKLAVGMELLLIFIAYTFAHVTRVVGYEGTHLLYLWFFLGLGALFTLSASATVMSSERESRAWPA